jgi:hypothetical protein
VKPEQLDELIYQMLETERGGIQVYETALRSRRRITSASCWR